jgi:hypothetical protein
MLKLLLLVYVSGPSVFIESLLEDDDGGGILYLPKVCSFCNYEQDKSDATYTKTII